METIAINSLRAIDPIPAKANLLILDDICDGGRTFIGVAQAIRDTCPDHGSIELAITHGLFTFGTEIVTKHFDKVYTTNSYYRAEDHMDDKLKVVDIW